MSRVRWLAIALLTAACGRAEAPGPGEAPAGLPDPVRAALDRAPVPGSVAVELQVPADGTVFPWTFPAPAFRWDDRHAANSYRVRVRPGGRGVVVEATTGERTLTLPAAAWQAVREAAGEGGAFDVELVAASVLPDGTVLRGPAVAVSHARFSGPGEHPTGHVEFGRKIRPIGASPGPVAADFRAIVAARVSMDGTVETRLDRLPGIDKLRGELKARNQAQGEDWGESPPLPVPGLDRSRQRTYGIASDESLDVTQLPRQAGVPPFPLDPPSDRTCFSCHSVSGNGEYLALSSQEDEAVPEGWMSSQGVLFVIRVADHHVMQRVPAGLFPRFHPLDPNLLVYARSSNSTGAKQRVSVLRADLHVLDVTTGLDRPVPGASDPDRCELFADWSPDGRSLAFTRSAPGEPCEGSRGRLEIATVPWNEGRGGEAVPLLAGPSEGSDVQPRYSPDGRWIVFYRAERGFFAMGTSDLFVVPAAGGDARRLEVSTSAQESFHAFSPDGHWLAFVTNRDRVDRPRGWVARFFDDGHTAAPVPLPGAGDLDAHVHTLDWGP